MVHKAVVTTVLAKTDDDEHDLRIDYESDTIAFLLDGKEVFSGDWTNNFRKVFQEIEKLASKE